MTDKTKYPYTAWVLETAEDEHTDVTIVTVLQPHSDPEGNVRIVYGELEVADFDYMSIIPVSELFFTWKSAYKTALDRSDSVAYEVSPGVSFVYEFGNPPYIKETQNGR